MAGVPVSKMHLVRSKPGPPQKVANRTILPLDVPNCDRGEFGTVPGDTELATGSVLSRWDLGLLAYLRFEGGWGRF